MNAMNQHEEFKEKPVIDPVTGQPLPQPTAQTHLSDVPVEPPRRSSWPIIIILLAGLVLALIAWLPAELSRDTANTAAPPATTDQPATGTTGQATPPADTGTAPAGGTTTQPAPEATPQQGTQGASPNSTPGTTPEMTQPAP
ncbi:hypothetical protein IB263_03450 [Ensifer sp. ENS03]|nr:hypothetical protein [Ensifer sp. ENS03]MBD9622065.1 hypothetical protein [Ensifer sp. ENS06]